MRKTDDCNNPISGAFYSSIFVYRDKDTQTFSLHAGANIDPEKAEYLKKVEHRNCAEKQAALSGAMHQMTNKELAMMFLYRKNTKGKEFPAEKLVPCMDCNSQYVQDLIKNDGKLILLIDDDMKRDFFMPGYKDAAIASSIKKIKPSSGQEFFYTIFNSEAMKFMKVETQLGGRVCNHSHHHHSKPKDLNANS